MKLVLSAVSMVNSIGASMVILFTLFGSGRLEGSLLWIVIKLSTSVLVIAIGILTFLYTMNAIRWDHTKPVLLLGGLSLVAIGSASASVGAAPGTDYKRLRRLYPDTEWGASTAGDAYCLVSLRGCVPTCDCQ